MLKFSYTGTLLKLDLKVSWLSQTRYQTDSDLDSRVDSVALDQRRRHFSALMVR